MTEDMVVELSERLSNLGTSEEAARLRARMQSAQLLSDMQAFKVMGSIYWLFATVCHTWLWFLCRQPILVVFWPILFVGILQETGVPILIAMR